MLARARVLVRVLMCAYVLRNVCDYVGLWWSVCECVRVSLCALMRLSVFVFVVCVVVHVCVSVCLCVCMRGKDYRMAFERVPHGPNRIYERSPTWQSAWPHFPSTRLGSANPMIPLLNH